jgi:hypothetical protein
MRDRRKRMTYQELKDAYDHVVKTREQAVKEIMRLEAKNAELLAASEATLEYWESDPSGFAECEPGCDCIVDQLRAAIAKARQENE